MKAVVLRSAGEPSEVLECREVPIPEPGPGEVRVRMLASPVNPSDLLYARDRYTMKPNPPCGVGFEGVGVVEKAGPGLLGRLLSGRRGCVINPKGGNWAEYAVVPANRVVPVSSGLPDEQVACFLVNPATALAMVRHVLKVPRGAWLVQSAAGSALGRMVIRLGRRDGFKTLNVVRRREAVGEILKAGGDAAICPEDGPIEEQIAAIAKGDPPRHAIDPVGGETGTRIFRALGDGGRLLVYGTLSGQPICLNPRDLFGGRRSLEGFYLGWWLERRSIVKNLRLFREIGGLIREGVLETEIGSIHGLDRIGDAVRDAESPGRSGKVLLRMGDR